MSANQDYYHVFRVMKKRGKREANSDAKTVVRWSGSSRTTSYTENHNKKLHHNHLCSERAENLILSAKRLNFRRRWTFQQDNNPTGKITQVGLEWPRQSPDLNPTGNLERILKLQVHHRDALITLGNWRQFAKRIRPKLNHNVVKKLLFTVDVLKLKLPTTALKKVQYCAKSYIICKDMM